MKSILDEIHRPNDLKKLDIDELNILSKEIREYLIKVINKTGGHLSSNLGVVELTIALHYVFDSPYDKLIWDVGHQSYVHKILTGRKEALTTIRKYNGLSGFIKRGESEHDIFEAGHSSTSISAALGFAVARDIQKKHNSVVAIIGDGALSAGMAYEALNNGSRLKSNFIIILNDNQMSISKNVGGMAQYLDSIRTSNTYTEIKGDVHKVLNKLPVIGERLTKVIKDVKNGIKKVFIPGMFFEEMGYTYLGPVDGHSIQQVTKVLNIAKKIDGPVLVHIHTIKGKGYHKAELNPSKYHGIKPAISESATHGVSTVKEVTYGELLGEHLIKYVKSGKLVVGITAAMPSGTGLAKFAKMCPKEFFDVGIAEQHAITFAAGLALQGIKPFVAIYSTFLQRAYDQLLHDVCIQKVPIVVLLDRAGIVGEDGKTHQGVYDLSFLNHMPNMTIMAPRDDDTFKMMLDYSLEYNEGPIAIRYPKGSMPHYNIENAPLVQGISECIKEGNNIAVLAVGSMVGVALEVAEGLDKDMAVIDVRFIKPVDTKLLDSMVNVYHTIIIIEENAKTGGYGSEVIRYINENNYNIKVYLYGIPDKFISHGPRKQLLKDVGLDKDYIIKDLKSKVELWR